MKSFIFILLAIVGIASSVTLEPTQDTYSNVVSNGGACLYRGSEPAIFSGTLFGGTKSTGWTLFDLSGVSTVNSATLQGDVDGITGNGHAINRTAIGWTEATLSGTTVPGLSGCPTLPSNIGTAGSGTVSAAGILSVSVTSAVSAALSSGAVSFSIAFTDAGVNRGTNFCPREASDSSKRPKLIIT